MSGVSRIDSLCYAFVFKLYFQISYGHTIIAEDGCYLGIHIISRSLAYQ